MGQAKRKVYSEREFVRVCVLLNNQVKINLSRVKRRKRELLWQNNHERTNEQEKHPSGVLSLLQIEQQISLFRRVVGNFYHKSL